MKTPFVSVVIDTYNYGQYIEEAVRSALVQDFPVADREIIVVDDGSTDDTELRLKKFGAAIRYFRKPNRGQASAFNFGFRQARGQIVALLDADDVWLENKLRRVCETFEKMPQAQMVYHRAYLWKGNGEISVDTNFARIDGYVPGNRATLLQYPMIATSCLAFRQKTLQVLLPVPEALRSQADAYLTALVVFVAPVVAVPEFLAKYRVHGANAFQMNGDAISRAQIERRMTARAALQTEIRNWLVRYGHNPTSPDLKAYLKQWKKAQEVDAFRLEAPGRWKFFCHLIEYPRTYGEIMSVRHRIYSYARAFASLLLGYHHLHLVDEFRGWYKRLLGKLPAKIHAARTRQLRLEAQPSNHCSDKERSEQDALRRYHAASH
jgi:glycosyltransferase involved in cell wall biosynthesis